MFISYRGTYYNTQQIVRAKKDTECYNDADGEYVEREILELYFSNGDMLIVKGAEAVEEFILSLITNRT